MLVKILKSTRDTPPMSETSVAPPSHAHLLFGIMLIVVILGASIFVAIYGISRANAPQVMVTRSPCLRFEKANFAATNESITGAEWVNHHIRLDMLVIENCCLKDFEVDWVVSGQVIQVNIRSPLLSVTEACKCVCPFMVHVDLGPFPSGLYYVTVFHHEVLIGETSGVLN